MSRSEPLVALLLLVLLGVSFAWVGVPLLRERSEQNAFRKMEQIRDALGKYRNQRGGYPREFKTLVIEGHFGKEFADGMGGGYRGYYTATDEIGSDGICRRFDILVRPERFSFAKRAFFLDETGVLVFEDQMIPAPPDWIAPDTERPSSK